MLQTRAYLGVLRAVLTAALGAAVRASVSPFEGKKRFHVLYRTLSAPLTTKGRLIGVHLRADEDRGGTHVRTKLIFALFLEIPRESETRSAPATRLFRPCTS